MPTFTQSQMEAIADALGDTEHSLTGREIGHLLQVATIPDPSPSMAKRHRILNGFVESQNVRQDRGAILKFLRQAMKPERYLGQLERYEAMRARLNRALAFAGLAFDSAGVLDTVNAVTTITEAERRARDLREDLVRRGVHPDVLAFCRAEVLAEDYFHAVLEAVKSVGDKLRSRTGLTDDGSVLVDRALGGDPPMLAINGLRTQDERSEQRGFANLVRGVFGMFRNPTAHAPRVHWAMDQEDAEDLLSMVSLIHRRLDRSTMPPRV